MPICFIVGNTTGDFLLTGDRWNGKIYSIDIETMAVKRLPVITNYTGALGYDTKENTVYWSNSNRFNGSRQENLSRINIDGTDERTVYTGIELPFGIFLP